MKQLGISHVLAAMVLFAMLNTPALAEPHHAKLVGFQEVPVVVSAGTGHFKMNIAPGGDSFEFELTYDGLEGTPVTQAHIHVAQRNVNGGIVIWLCSNLASPPTPPSPPGAAIPTCPLSGPVTGTRTAVDVQPQTTQGISAMELSAVITAIRQGKAYANVHTTASPGGEIRGQIK
jgi:CHRD domain